MRYRLNLDRLAALLAGSRVSQNHWALKLGFSRGHWSDIVNGRHPFPSEKTRVRMLEVFGVNDLFVGEPSQRGADVDFRIAISGRYELTSEIGQGGMGSVYLANDLALGRLLALKVVSAEATAGIGADQLLKEIAVVARLQHPNILPLFDAGTGAGSPYYVMPYVRTGSLGARLRERGRLPLQEVIGLVREIAAGLGHAHAHRILHCDIKPENILVDGAHPYLMDFGIARKLHAEAQEWESIRKELDFSAGTPAYVSPEQAAGNRELDARSDVYSLACVVYELLTGRHAFSGANTQEIVSLRFREPPPPLQEFAPEVPASVVRVLEQAMALDVDRRPAGAEEFAAQLSHAAGSASELATRISLASTRTQRWVRARFGRPTPAVRTGGIARMFEAFTQDLVYGFRQRVRTPALSIVALLTLAIGIGLTTTAFALIDAVLLRPLPFANQERLVALESVDSVNNHIRQVSSSNWYDWKTSNSSLDGIAIYMVSRSSIGVRDHAMRVQSGWVSAEFFNVTGARFLFGRNFDSAEVAARRGGAIVTEEFWQRELGGARDTGLAIRYDGYRMPVIGVLARGQAFPPDVEVWTAYTHRQTGGMARNNINWLAIGRLKPNVTIERAEADLSAIARHIHEADSVAWYSYGVHVAPVRDQMAGDVHSMLILLSGAVGVVLLIACANLASANLAQGARRQREMAVRSALGAGRARILRQVLVENVAMAFAAGVLGVGLAWILLRSSIVVGAAELPRITEIGINVPVLLMSIGAALFAGVVTGILPALQASRAAPNDVLGGSVRGAVSGGRGLAGRVLVGAEIAMALVLVTGAGLFIESLRTVLSKPLGIETAHTSYAEISLGGPKFRDTNAYPAYWETLAGAMRATPGIRAAAIAGFVPLVRGGTGQVEVEGLDAPAHDVGYRYVSDGYFDAVGMQRIAGRDFGNADGKTTERVALVNKTMADKYWPGQSPIGRRLRATSMEPPIGGQPTAWITVIGVVSDVRHFGYEHAPDPEMFVLYRQLPYWRLTAMSVIAHGEGSDASLEDAMRKTIARIDGTIPADISSLDAAAKRTTAARRFSMRVLGVFGVLSLLLASIGVYGVLSFAVAQRTREIAVRSALGADRSKLLRLIYTNAGAVVLAGMVVGVGAVFALGRLVESMLFEVKASNPMIVAIAAVVIAATGALAAAIPARRATRVDPMTVLRNDA